MANTVISNASSIALPVRECDLAKDGEAVIQFLSTHLSPQADASRFEWLYLKNPAGRARAWISTLPESHEIVGVAAAFPRRMRFDGKLVQGWVLGDFCIHPNHRSLGPALTLQRQCLAGLARSGADVIYDFPSEGMLGVYKRLRMDSGDSMSRFAKPLRLDRRISEWVPISFLVPCLSIPCNLGLRIWDARWRKNNKIAVEFQTVPCGEEFTIAANLWGKELGTSALRTADYLNWRYFQHPQVHHELLTARRRGELLGYLVLRHDGQDAAIVDMLADGNDANSALLLGAVSILRRRVVQTLSFPLSSSSPLKSILKSFGFHPRESRPIVQIFSLGTSSAEVSRSGGSWYLTDGDRES
jgi:hypothetical protein